MQFFFFVFIIFRLTRPGFSLYHLIISHGQFYHFMLLHEKFSNDLLYFSVVTVTVTLLLESVCLLSSQMHLSAYTFTDTLIVSLHSLHFHICLGPGPQTRSHQNVPKAFISLKTCVSFRRCIRTCISHIHLICHWF